MLLDPMKTRKKNSSNWQRGGFRSGGRVAVLGCLDVLKRLASPSADLMELRKDTHW